MSRLPSNPRSPEDASAPAADDGVGEALVQQLRQLEERSTPGLAAQVMPVFLRDTTNRLSALRDAIASGNSVEAHRVAHTIHGSAASIGAVTMVRACGEILRNIKQHQLDQCASLVGTLVADFDSIRRAAEAHGIATPQ